MCVVPTLLPYIGCRAQGICGGCGMNWAVVAGSFAGVSKGFTLDFGMGVRMGF